MKLNRNVLVLAFVSSIFSTGALAQDYKPQKNSIGFNLGALSYAGRFSVDAPLSSYSSLYGSFAYRVKVWKNLYVRAEALGGRLRGDNTDVESQASKPTGSFQTEIGELTVKAEYDLLELRNRKVTPFVNMGAGVYSLFNYTSTESTKSSGDKTGFILPVGGGVKYKLTNRIKLLAEGHLRFFPKNLDGRTGEGINNPNRYYSVGVGVIYELEPSNVLW